MAIDQVAFKRDEWWGIRYLERFITSGRILLAGTSSKICGFIAFESNKIMKLGVIPDFHRRGIGGNLLDEAMKVIYSEFKKLSVILHVDPRNDPAVKLYRSRNFEKDSIVTDYYGQGSDAWRMLKDR